MDICTLDLSAPDTSTADMLAPRGPSPELERLGDEIAELSAHLDAATARLLDLIRDAGFKPVERNTLYQTVREYAGPEPALRETPQPMRV